MPQQNQAAFQSHLVHTTQPPAHALAAQHANSYSGPEWFLDSRATHHVTNNLNSLSSYMPYEGFDTLHIGNGTGMEIQNIGSTQLKFSTYSFLLKDVLHVPSFTKNLLSLSKLLRDNDILIEFGSNFCEIKERRTLRTILQVRLLSGLYMVSPSSFSPQACFGERVSADLWHTRLGHPSSMTTLKILHEHSLPCLSNKMSLCHHCCEAKAHKLPFSLSSSISSHPLELVHSDVWGPAPVVSHNGFRYFVIFVDDFTRYVWIYFLHTKDEVVRVFSSFKSQVENLLSHSIKTLRTDGGSEYFQISGLFPSIVHQKTCPYTPQQNGVSERKHRHIIELALAIMAHASFPTKFWDDIFSSVVYLINRLPSSDNAPSPFFRLFGKTPDYMFLRVLGCLCFPYIRPYNDHKLQSRSLPCVFLGYSLCQKGYKCLHLDSNKIFISRHVLFDENHFPFKKLQLSDDSASDYAC